MVIFRLQLLPWTFTRETGLGIGFSRITNTTRQNSVLSTLHIRWQFTLSFPRKEISMICWLFQQTTAPPTTTAKVLPFGKYTKFQDWIFLTFFFFSFWTLILSVPWGDNKVLVGAFFFFFLTRNWFKIKNTGVWFYIASYLLSGELIHLQKSKRT